MTRAVLFLVTTACLSRDITRDRTMAGKAAAAINPKPADVYPLVPELRAEFKKKYGGSMGDYDPRDVKRFEENQAMAASFLRTVKVKTNIQKAVDMVHECFKFRKENGLNDLTDASFPQEVLDKNGMYYKGTDIDGRKILYIDVKANSTKSDEVAIVKKYAAYMLDKQFRDNPEEMYVALFDMSGAGTGNLNTDMFKYFITCFGVYFPGALAYMLNYEMGALLAGIWKIVSTFLNSDQSKKIIMCGKKDIAKYIPESSLWDHMKK